MKKTLLAVACTAGTLACSSNTFAFDFFKTESGHGRNTISIGWLHAIPSKKTNNMENRIVVPDRVMVRDANGKLVIENGKVKTKEWQGGNFQDFLKAQFPERKIYDAFDVMTNNSNPKVVMTLPAGAVPNGVVHLSTVEKMRNTARKDAGLPLDPEGKALTAEDFKVLGAKVANAADSYREWLTAYRASYASGNPDPLNPGYTYPGNTTDRDLSKVDTNGQLLNHYTGKDEFDASGWTTNLNLADSWVSPGTGLYSQPVDTVGIMMNYYLTDNWSIESKAGIPPKVDIMGKGKITSDISGKALSQPIQGRIKALNGLGIPATVPAIDPFDVADHKLITDMEKHGVASTARAWLPAWEVHYHFGKPGKNKFRPYIGLGVMVAFFTDIEMNPGLENDLKASGHMIQNLINGEAGAASEGRKSFDPATGKEYKMGLDVKTDPTFGPIATIGATYDLTENVFAVASVSYSKLSTKNHVTIKNEDTGQKLVEASSKVNIDSVITYTGIGYRF